MRTAVLWSGLLSVMPGLLFSVSAQEALIGQHVRAELRGRPADPQMFRLIGVPVAHDQTEIGPEGLRIRLPPPNKKPLLVGLLARFRARGDFEVTCSYELLHLPRPDKGNGVGVSLYVRLDNTKKDTLFLGRVHRVREGDVYATTHTTTTAEGKRLASGNTFPTDCVAGRLRLARTGNVVRYAAAEGADGEFVELRHLEVPGDDLEFIRVGGDPGSSDCPLDIRIQDFAVRADAILDEDAPPLIAGGPASPPDGRSTTYLLAVSLLLLLALAVGLWVALRHANKNRGDEGAAEETATPAPSDEV